MHYCSAIVLEGPWKFSYKHDSAFTMRQKRLHYYTRLLESVSCEGKPINFINNLFCRGNGSAMTAIACPPLNMNKYCRGISATDALRKLLTTALPFPIPH